MIEKISYNKLESEINKKLLHYLSVYKKRIIIYLILCFFVYLIVHLPYLNLIFSPSIEPYIFTLSLFVIFPFSGKGLLKISIFAFILMMGLSVLQKNQSANLLGDLTYFVLLISVIKLTKEFIEEN